MNKNLQILSLNYCIKNPKLFRYVYEFQDTDNIKRFFSFVGVHYILQILIDHYKKHNEILSRDLFEDIKFAYIPFRDWWNDASLEERSDFVDLENKLFSDLKDINFTKDRVKSLLIETHAAFFRKKEQDEIIKTPSRVVEIFEEYTDKRKKFLLELEIDLEANSRESSFFTDVTEDFELLKGITPLKTHHPSINFYPRGLTLLVSDAKMFKTGISNDIVLYLADTLGMDVILFDLENGLHQMLIRLVQGYMNIPREWIYADTFVDKEELNALRYGEDSDKNYLEYDPAGVYMQGERYYKIYATREIDSDKKVKGFDNSNISWKINVGFYEVIAEGTGSTAMYRKLDNVFYDKTRVFSPLLPRLRKKLKELNTGIKGNIKIEYLKKPTPSSIKRSIEFCINDDSQTGQTFYKDPKARVAVIDWLALMKNDNQKLATWEQMRQTYLDLKEIRKEYDVSMLAIEGVSNPEELSKAVINPYDVKTMNSRRSTFDAEAVVALCATTEERKHNYRRIETLYDRYSENTVSYIRVHPNTQQVEILDFEGHEDTHLLSIDDRSKKQEKRLVEFALYQTLCPDTFNERGMSAILSPEENFELRQKIQKFTEPQYNDLDGIDIVF